MNEDEQQDVIGQEPENDGGEDTQSFDAEYVRKLRDEAAKYRRQLRETQDRVKNLEPKATEFDKLQDAAKTETERMSEQLATLQAKVAEAETNAQRAQAQARVVRLATKAGIDPDVAQMLDVSQFAQLEDDDAVKLLAKLAPTRAAGSVSNAGRTGASASEDLRAWWESRGGKTTIFGS